MNLNDENKLNEIISNWRNLGKLDEDDFLWLLNCITKSDEKIIELESYSFEQDFNFNYNIKPKSTFEL